MIERIADMLRTCDGDSPSFPPTELYNESWLLRLVLDGFFRHGDGLPGHPLAFAEGARWYSEAWLPSAFAPRWRRDPLGEGWTHADGVIGHFSLGKGGKQDVSLPADATQFVVVEAKMFSRLSKGVTHAPDYDQAARTVACMAEVIARQPAIAPNSLERIGFYVLAPECQIADKKAFGDLLTKESIADKVGARVGQYKGDRDAWHDDYFEPLLPLIAIEAISWERVIDDIKKVDSASGDGINTFYQECKKYNKK